jgi:hypothetical protein
MALWSNTDTAASKPKNLTTAEKNATLGISVNEANAAANKAKGLGTPGWVKYTTYTDAQGSTRHKSEVLVAISSLTGDNDTITPEIQISLLNATATRLVGQSWTITAVATVNPPQAATFTYQWQVSADDGVTWTTAPGDSTSNEYTTNNPTAGTFNYRVLVSSDVADTEISSSGTVIVVTP